MQKEEGAEVTGRGAVKNKEAVVEESLLDQIWGTDCDVKVQTVSNSSGSACFNRHFPRHWSKDKAVAQTKYTHSQ